MTTADFHEAIVEGKRPRSCFNKNGERKHSFESRKKAKASALKHQEPYACEAHGWHLCSKRNAARGQVPRSRRKRPR